MFVNILDINAKVEHSMIHKKKVMKILKIREQKNMKVLFSIEQLKLKFNVWLKIETNNTKSNESEIDKLFEIISKARSGFNIK